MIRTTNQTGQTETLDELVTRLYGMREALYRDAKAHPRRYIEHILRISAAQNARHGVLGPITRYAARVTRHQQGCTCARCSGVRVAAKRYARMRGVL